MTLAAIPRPKVWIKHASIVYDDPDLFTRRVHGIGFRAVCSCGWRSRVAGSYHMAIGSKREHERTHR